MPQEFLVDAGGLGPTYRAVDWARTAVGTPETWAEDLRAALRLVLGSRFPMALHWGPDLALLYNEAYVELIADKHPAALGAAARDVFPEAWETIGPMLQGVLDDRTAVYVDDLRVPLARRGFLEECYFTFSYSAVRDVEGQVSGVFAVASETTRAVVGRRRLALLSRLREALVEVEDPAEVRGLALPLLRADPDDLPAVDLQVLGEAGPDADDRLPPAPRPGWGGEGVVTDEPAGRVVRLPVVAGSAAGPPSSSLVVLLHDQLPLHEGYLDFLRLLASTLSQALERAHAREAEQRVAAAERALSRSLQASLLTPPLQPPGMDVAVRYLPAAEEARVGGDWYDSFLLDDGTVTLVVGDVAGHDLRAAALMAQVRNLLRGVAATLQTGPAAVLECLDRGLRSLSVSAYATVVVAQVGPCRDDGSRVLRWSNAGHPPPVLVTPEGARLLETEPELLLGLGTDDHRTDHEVVLPPGGGVVMCTDGLLERRDRGLEDGLERLVAVLDGCREQAVGAIVDRLLAELAQDPEDDVAVLVARQVDERHV